MTGYTVYKHTAPSNKVYIGITQQHVNRRWHLDGSGYKGQVFWNAICTYGWENIRHEIIATGLDKESAEKMEVDLIRKYNSANSKYGYNAETGGFARPKATPETLKRMSEAQKGNKSSLGRVLSDETKRKIGSANRGKQPRLGAVLSEKTKAKISAAHKGNNYCVGRPMSECCKQRMAEGRARWLEEKQKEIEAKKAEKAKLAGERRKHTKQHQIELLRKSCERRMKPVIQIGKDGTTLARYCSLTEASKITGFDKGSISACCLGKSKTAYGFVWQYIDAA